jgi:hypothetical protein
MDRDGGGGDAPLDNAAVGMTVRVYAGTHPGRA